MNVADLEERVIWPTPKAHNFAEAVNSVAATNCVFN